MHRRGRGDPPHELFWREQKRILIVTLWGECEEQIGKW